MIESTSMIKIENFSQILKLCYPYLKQEEIHQSNEKTAVGREEDTETARAHGAYSGLKAENLE